MRTRSFLRANVMIFASLVSPRRDSANWYIASGDISVRLIDFAD